MFAKIITIKDLIVPEELENKKIGDKIDFLESITGEVMTATILYVYKKKNALRISF